MKRLFSIFAFMLIVTSMMAQPRTSLAIQSGHHEHFWVYLNNTLQNQDPVESIYISNLSPTTYTVRIIIDNRDYTEFTTSLQLHGGANNFEVNYNPRDQRISLRSVDYEIHAAVAMTASFTNMVNTMFEMQENDMHGRPGEGHDHHHHPGGHDAHHSHHEQHPTPPAPRPVAPPPAPQPIAPPPPMPCSDQDFREIKQIVQHETFENQKLTIAKQATAAELLTVDQLAEIAMLFDFENTKLEYLKFAYDYCFDKNKYYKLNKVFDFSSSVDELNEYIQGR